MSAYLVTRTHISSLIATALHGPSDNAKGIYPGSRFTGFFTWSAADATAFGGYAQQRLDTSTADTIGAMLWQENLNSVNARYSEADTLPERYRYQRPARRLSIAEALKAIACYEYQSCEHDGWHASSAQRFCDALRHELISVLPGYDDAKWGIEDDPDAPTFTRPNLAPAAAVTAAAPMVAPPVQQETRYLSPAETAKALRVALKGMFPAVKFSVTSSRYSGGASIDVTWTDGPTAKRVEAISKRYAGASFDGMTDLKSHHSTEHQGERVQFGADYVFSHRRHSLALLRQAVELVTADYGVTAPRIVTGDFEPYCDPRDPATNSHPGGSGYTFGELVYQAINNIEA